VNNNKKLNILGIRGIPANHGGFETFAEAYSLYLVDRGWDITVYCQEEGKGKVYESIWNNINRVHIPVSKEGPLGTIIFDFKCVIHSLKKPGLILSLGYNTAIFNILFPLFKRPNIINMDGIEWKRGKWGKLAKLWFRINEWIGCKVGDHLIADNEVLFLGAIYDSEIISSLRYFSYYYFHGHTVGGTNPSLVESLAAGCPVIAHNNSYNSWVAKEGALYFDNKEELGFILDKQFSDIELREEKSKKAIQQHRDHFQPHYVLGQYESLSLLFCGDYVADSSY